MWYTFVTWKPKPLFPTESLVIYRKIHCSLYINISILILAPSLCCSSILKSIFWTHFPDIHFDETTQSCSTQYVWRKRDRRTNIFNGIITNRRKDTSRHLICGSSCRMSNDSDYLSDEGFPLDEIIFTFHEATTATRTLKMWQYKDQGGRDFPSCIAWQRA